MYLSGESVRKQHSSSRILLGAESFGAVTSGIAKVARLMARVLSEEMGNGKLVGKAVTLNDGVPLFDLAFPNIAASGSRVRFIFEVHKAALSHSHFVYDCLGMARAHCRFPRKPFMTWIHGVEVWENIRADRLRCSRKADMLLANSSYTRDRADSFHRNFGRARVCWLGTEDDAIPQVAALRDGPPTVLMVARIDERGGYKGHMDVLECWREIQSSLKSARLVIVGNGPGLPTLKRKAAERDIAQSVSFLGIVPQHEMGKVWANATVFVMPSRGEGFGLVYAEAMRYGIPVVASVHDAGQEINVDGETGFNVDLDRVAELPERIIFLLKNRDEAVRLARNGQARWKQHFCYTAFRARFLPILREFLQAYA